MGTNLKTEANVGSQDGKLTAKMEKFCRAYIANEGNASAAARAAGYNNHSGKLVKNPKVVYRIQQLRDEASQRFDLTIDNVTNKLLQVYDGALRTEQYAAANRSAELLGKHLGMFVDRTQHTHTIEGLTSGQDTKAVESDLQRLVKIAQTTEDFEEGKEIYVPEQETDNDES